MGEPKPIALVNAERETSDTGIQNYVSNVSDSHIYEGIWIYSKSGVKSVGKTTMSGQKGGIFGRNSEKGVNVLRTFSGIRDEFFLCVSLTRIR